MQEISIQNQTDCRCFNPPFHFADFASREIGIDDRHAEISVEICIFCGQNWLKYFYESEFFSRSGRWYRGTISENESLRIKANEAIGYLENLDWYFIGGSFFESTGKISKGRIVL